MVSNPRSASRNDLRGAAAPSQVASAASCLAGGGEMGAVMRAMDWSKTALGPVDTWSQTLRMMVGFLLANRFPLLLWWGPKFCQLYNDAYRPILGAKHPMFVGQPSSECWSEVWHVIGPLVETPFSGGPATWMEDIPLELNRHGFIEETHFTIAYSPVPDETAPRGIGGVLATVHEITEKVVAERRVVALRDLGARAMAAKTAEEACTIATEALAEHAKDIPFALIYLVDNDGKQARLAGSTGVRAGESISPRVIALESTVVGDPGWHLAEVLRTDAMLTVEDLGERFAAVPPGPWSDAPRAAIIAPIRSNRARHPAGFLVAAVSPRLRLDDLYRGFFELVAGQIATAVANARAHEEERRRAEALAEIDRAKTAFFTNVSHEFRTPLTLMLGPLEDALAGPAQALPERHADLALVHRNGQRLLRLVNTLLDFSRIEAGRVQASYEPVDLGAFTADLASVFRAATEKAGLRLTIDCPPLAEQVWVDREMWEKIVLNLLSNAFKFTLEGGIIVRLRAEGGEVTLTVEDTGTGIPAHELPHLFDRFHRVQGAHGRTHEGTGIGLALVHELARQHGGSVRVESTLGEGSRFKVTIPLGHAHLPSDRLRAERVLASTATGAQPFVADALRWLSGGPASEESIADPIPTGSLVAEADTMPRAGERPVVLLADDNADMRDYVRRLLDTRYEVRTAEDGAAALAAARQSRPDLLLSDVMMPRLDGFGLVQEIRGDPALADLPVILLSARAGEEASIEGLEAGADDYLVKPFTARELLARVASTLKMATLRRELEQHTAADLAAMTRLERIGRTCIDASVAFDDCLLEILDAAVALTGADKGNIQLINARSGTLDIAVQRGLSAEFVTHFAALDPSYVAASTAAMRSRERVVVEDVADSELFAGQPSRAVILSAGVRAVHSVPLLSGTGAMLGVISVHYARPYSPSERDMRLMDVLARQAGDYLERRQADRALRELNDALEQKVEARTRALEAEMIERQKAEAALQQVRRLEAVGQLTGGIAHDFNNLLTVVMSLSESIATAAKGNDRITRMAATTQRAAERGAQLTSQLLSFSGKQQLRPVTVAVDALIRSVSDLVRRAIGENITVALAVDHDLWASHLDPAQLESAILNLAINARDAMPRGGSLVIAGRNKTLSEREALQLDLAPGDYVIASVTDNGAGMTAEVRRRAFEPFFTTKDVGKGTGLGLSQIYGFVRQSGGMAAIDSTVGIGTTVMLYFPRATQPLADEPHVEASSEAAPGRGRTVLVVEDQSDVRDVIEMSLGEMGYRVLVAPDGVAARRILDSPETIDLLLTDVMMPGGVSGLDLARSARRLRQDLKVVVVSGYLRDDDGESEVSGLTFLEKPFLPAALTNAVATALASAPRCGVR